MEKSRNMRGMHGPLSWFENTEASCAMVQGMLIGRMMLHVCFHEKQKRMENSWHHWDYFLVACMRSAALPQAYSYQYFLAVNVQNLEELVAFSGYYCLHGIIIQ
jgi:hypothetical protein